MAKVRQIRVSQPQVSEDEVQNVANVMRRGSLAQGAEVQAFEDEFSKIAVSGFHCVAVNSGTSALHLSLLAAGIGRGDEVIVPSFSFAATANAVAMTGAVPIFADINPRTFCMSVESTRERICAKTRAILPVHLYGHPADMPRFAELCTRHGLILLEDAAQAHLASLDGRQVGTWGSAAAFSFYATKNMTTGEGGMVSTKDPVVARGVRLLRNQGQEIRYHNELVGLNNRMTEMQAAIGRAQLRRLGQWTAVRQANAAYLSRNLTGVVTPVVVEGAVHVYHQYTVRLVDLDRDLCAEHLKSKGIGSGVYYPTPIHRLPPYRQDLDLPETCLAATQVLSLPIHPGLSPADLDRIVSTMNSFVSAGVGGG